MEFRGCRLVKAASSSDNMGVGRVTVATNIVVGKGLGWGTGLRWV